MIGALAAAVEKVGLFMKSLIELGEGSRAFISSIKGDRRYLSRITSIGLNAGCMIRMLQNVHARPVLVFGRDTMIALSREESRNIFVEDAVK